MKVKEVIKKLKQYDPDAKFQTVVNNYPEEFEVCFGDQEGVSKEDCQSVALMINCKTEGI